MVETLVALGVIFTTLLVLAFTMFTAFKSVGFSRQRTEATALANQALEQIRALPADELFMSMTDTAPSDAQLQPAGCVSAGTCTFNSRTVPMSNFGSTPPTTPLVPHVTSATPAPGTSVYTIKSYLTIDPLDSSNQTRIATVQVSWSNPQQSGVSPNVQVESKLHSAPFNETAPGTHSYTASATGQPATVSITGTMLNRNGINVALNFSQTNAYFAGGIGGTNVGPVGNLVAGGSAPSTISAALIPPVTTGSSVATASSPAGTGPNGPNSGSYTAVSLAPLHGTGGGLGGTGDLTIVMDDTTGNAVAASQANGQTSAIPGMSLPNSRLGYGKATASQSGPVAANLDLLGLLNLGLVSVTPAGNAVPDVATVAESTSTYTASASKSFTQVKVVSGLPLLGPVVQFDSFQSSVSACAAAPGGSCPPATPPTDNGTLRILGVIVPFSPTSSPVTLPVTVPNITIPLLGTLAVTASVIVGAAVAASAGSATVTSPLSVSVHLSLPGLLDLTVAVDLGTLTASSTYT